MQVWEALLDPPVPAVRGSTAEELQGGPSTVDDFPDDQALKRDLAR